MARRKRHPGHIQYRGGAARVRLCVGGRRHTFTIRTTDRSEAERFAASKFAELSAYARRGDTPTDERMSELLAKFEAEVLPTLAPGAAGAYEDSLKPIRSFFVELQRDQRVTDVRTKDVRAFVSWRRVHRIGGGTVKNRTIAKDRAVLHRIFDFALEHELREGNPVARVEVAKSDAFEPVILDDAQYERLIAACQGRPMLQLYVTVLGEAGLRSDSEALHLRFEDVDLERGMLRVVSGREDEKGQKHRTKSGRTRYVPMTARLRTAMREHFTRYRFAAIDGQPVPWVFHHETTRCHAVAGERINALYDGFKAAADRAKLPAALRQHDLRHRRVTTWLAAGKAAHLVQQAMGHSDIRTTLAYYHFVPEHLRTLVDELPDVEALRELA
jgi:site-specific recombinase XerD